jgi:hypothetical protein
MSETIYIEAEGMLMPVPRKGDLLAICNDKQEDMALSAVCLSVDTSVLNEGKRFPLVEVLYKNRIIKIPLKNVKILL